MTNQFTRFLKAIGKNKERINVDHDSKNNLKNYSIIFKLSASSAGISYTVPSNVTVKS
jgi:hypothetical protein